MREGRFCWSDPSFLAEGSFEDALRLTTSDLIHPPPPSPPRLERKTSHCFEDRLPREDGWFAEAPQSHHFLQGLACLKETVTLLDDCMRSVSRLGAALPARWCPSADVAGVSLTLASLHRLLFEYADDAVRRLTLACERSNVQDEAAAEAVLRCLRAKPNGGQSNFIDNGTSSSSSPKTTTTKATSSSRTRAVRAKMSASEPSETKSAALELVDGLRQDEALLDLVNCLVDAASGLPVDSGAARALPAPIGGMMMLLEYVSRGLRVLKKALNDAESYELKQEEARRRPLTGAALLVGGLCGGGAGVLLFLTRPRRHREIMAALAAGRRSLGQLILSTMKTTTRRRAPKVVLLCGVTAALSGRRTRRRVVGQRLAEAKAALEVAVGVWCCVATTLDEGLRLTRDDRSYCTLLNPKVRKLPSPPERCVLAAPPPATLSFWWRLGAPWQLQLVGLGATAWLAATYQAQSFGRFLFYPAAFARLPWYVYFSDAAARVASAACATPTIPWLLRAWRPLDTAPALCLARSWERWRGLSLQRDDVRIGGVPCFVCATGAVADSWRRLRREWTRDPHHRDPQSDDDSDDDDPQSGFDVIIHVHGGAFIAAFDAAHARWLHELADGANALVIAPAYSLAPTAAYPVAVDEVARVYDAVRAGDLGLQSVEAYGLKASAFYDHRKRDDDERWRRLDAEMRRDRDEAPACRKPRVATVSCSGESAGACILGSVMTRLAKKKLRADERRKRNSPLLLLRKAHLAATQQGQKMPDAVLLAYPPLNLYRCESPSRLIHLFDPLLPASVLVACSRAYCPTIEAVEDQADLMSSLASDAVLAQFPPTLLLCGGIDPLLDDAVDFHTRLTRAGVDAHLLVHRDLSHGFLGMLCMPAPFQPPTALPAARHAVRFLARTCAATKLFKGGMDGSSASSTTSTNGAIVI